jgi:hypothetical protein
MKKLYTLLAFFFPLISIAQLAIDWQRCYGGSGDEWPHRIQTADGGYIMLGNSGSIDGEVTNNHAPGLFPQEEFDMWVVKMDENGMIEWERCYGGSGYELGKSIIEDPNGGYIVIGETSSDDGDVSGNHTDFFGNPTGDIWVFKINDYGNLIWQRCLGGISSDDLRIVSVRADSFLLCAVTNSNDGDVVGYHEGQDSTLAGDGSGNWYYTPTNDVWVVKLNFLGEIVWQRCLGGTGREDFWGGAFIPTEDGGTLIACETYSSDGDVSGYHLGFDTTYYWEGTYSVFRTPDSWLVKLDVNGQLVWESCIGGTGDDQILSLTEDLNGFLGAGSTNSLDGDVQGLHVGAIPSARDAWIVKLDEYGVLLEQRCLGGSHSDGILQILPVDGGFIFTGGTYSSDGDVIDYHQGMNSEGVRTIDSWVFKLDYSGNIDWQNCLGGSGDDYLFSLDGSTFFGWTNSYDGDVIGIHGFPDFNYFLNDIWVTRLDDSGNLISQLCIGGFSAEMLVDAIPVQNGYLISARTSSNDGDVSGNYGYSVDEGSYMDIWLVKLSNIVNVDEYSTANPSIFPNPANDKLQVILNDHQNNTSYTIYDAQGRAVLSGVVESSRSEISVADLPPAFYTLQLAGRPGAVRFVKE